MSIPCVMVQMETARQREWKSKPFSFENEEVKREGEDSNEEKEVVHFELSQASLATMLEGLGKIRDQLNGVASAAVQQQ